MALNAWECGKCRRKVVGVGGAFGLRAIGWYVRYGGLLNDILCPDCRPDKIPCTDNEGNAGKSCPYCRAELEAKEYQNRMGERNWILGEDAYGPERDTYVFGDTFNGCDEGSPIRPKDASNPKSCSTKDLG